MKRLSREEGRTLFGRRARAYHEARPDYPERVYQLLVERCGLARGCRTLEVGAGSGRVTRRLLELGARPLVAVEPDPGFRAALEAVVRDSAGAASLLATSFESADVPRGAFDLAVCATSLHWLDPGPGLRKLGDCLRSGGWLAAFWNVFGDPEAPDPFHEATTGLLGSLAASPSRTASGTPFALDREARRADFRAAGADRELTVEEIRWTLTLGPDRLRSLYATFSPIARLPEPEREGLLDELAAVAEREFGGWVERRMVTPVYLGRRGG